MIPWSNIYLHDLVLEIWFFWRFLVELCKPVFNSYFFSNNYHYKFSINYYLNFDHNLNTYLSLQAAEISRKKIIDTVGSKFFNIATERARISRRFFLGPRRFGRAVSVYSFGFQLLLQTVALAISHDENGVQDTAQNECYRSK